MTRLELRIREAVINAHGSVMREETAQDWRLWLHELVQDEQLQMLRVNEVTDRTERAIAAALGKGWQIERRHDRPGSDEVLLAVKTSVGHVNRTRSLPMGGGTWIGGQTGRRHTPRQMLEVIIDTDVFQFAAAVLHAPPNVDVESEVPPNRRRASRRQKVARRVTVLRGKADVLLAWRRYWWRFRRWADGLNRAGIPWTGAGDVQEPQRSRGWTAPTDTAARVGGNAFIRGIDGWINNRLITVHDIKVVAPGPGMDHHAVLGTLVIPYRGGNPA